MSDSKVVDLIRSFFPTKYYQFIAKKDETLNAPQEGKYVNIPYVARLVHFVLRKSNLTETSDLSAANLIVGCDFPEKDLMRLLPGQRFNHFLRTFRLGTKSGYHEHMQKFLARCGFIPDFYPESYLIPAQYNELKKAFPTSKFWIMKTAGGSRGDGIDVINKLPKNPTKNYIVQRYMLNPLLIDGKKFDLRFYVAVTSIDPLKIYLFDNGLVRIAAEKYDLNEETITDKSKHLTNFSINKDNTDFKKTDNIEEDGTGNKWSHKPFWPFLEKLGFDIKDIKTKIEDAIVLTIMAARETLMDQPHPKASFELFGFDVIIDTEGNIKILEVNVSPALGTSSRLDLEIKGPLVRDLFNIAMIPIRTEKQIKISKIMEEGISEMCQDICICEYELTNSVSGGFNCIYPTKERIQSHSKYLLRETDLDIALKTWLLLDDSSRAEKISSLSLSFREL